VSDITATVAGSSISVAVASGGVSASVSGAPITAGITGSTGPQGPAGPAGSNAWSEITGKPTTLAGFGIVDAASLAHTHSASDIVSGTIGIARIPTGTSSATVCIGNDARLSDSREWAADTVSQAEAEAGTATTRRAWTALRVFQAVAAWWAASAAKTKLDGIASNATANSTDAQLRDRSTHTGTQPLSSLSQSSATTNQVATWNGTAWVAANVSATSIAWSSVTSTPTTLAGYGITDAASSTHTHGNLTNAGAIGSASGQIVVTTTSGVLTTAATISAATQVSGLAAVATSGSASDLGSGTLSASRLPTSGVSAGTYTSVTVDTYGRVTAGSSPAVAYSSLSGIPPTFAPSAHTHPLSDLSQSGATTNQVPQWNGTAWVPATVSGGAATTSAADLTSGTLNDARLSFVPLHPFLLMGA
jgi:hypothetical protein